MALLFHHTVGRAASRRQHRRSWHVGRCWKKPTCDLCNTRNSQHRKSIPSPSSPPESHATQWNASESPSSARLAPAKVLRPCGAESTRSSCPGSSREATFGCSDHRDELKEEVCVSICVPRLTSAGLPPRRADKRRRRVVAFVFCGAVVRVHLCFVSLPCMICLICWFAVVDVCCVCD